MNLDIMDFSEYFLSFFPKCIKKTIILAAHFFAWLDVIAFFGGIVLGFVGVGLKNDIMFGLGFGSSVAAVFAIIPCMLMFFSATFVDFKDQLRSLLEKEKKAAESSFKLSQSEQAKLAELKERRQRIEALEAKKKQKHTGTLGCVASVFVWSMIIVAVGYWVNLLSIMFVGWAMFFWLIIVAIMYYRSGYADIEQNSSRMAAQVQVVTVTQPQPDSQLNEPQSRFYNQQRTQDREHFSSTSADTYTNDDTQY